MIVLDEQLLGRAIETEIAKWYRGRVLFVTDLRPNTVIKDDGIPEILSQYNQPTFVTINERDFWRKMAINNRFCAICFSLSDARAKEIPSALRELLSHPELSTKAKRMGWVLRVTRAGVSYYTANDRTVQSM